MDVLLEYERYFATPPGYLAALRNRAVAERAAETEDFGWPPDVGGVEAAASTGGGHDGRGNGSARLGGLRHLPADLCDFVGRAEECDVIAQVAAMASGAVEWGRAGGTGCGVPAVVVLTGPGGIGKTSLAIHVAHMVADAFPDGQLFVDLRGYDGHPDDPSAVAARLLASIDGVAARPMDAITSLRSRMAGRRFLLLLDNAATESQVTPLLPASAGCLVIVTSRHGLGGLASVRKVRLQVLQQCEALELLSKVVGRDELAQTADAMSVAQMCGRLPLALRIAGARLAGGPPGKVEWLASRMRNDGDRLGALTIGDLDLSRVFETSYRALPAHARRVFRYAGLFPGPSVTLESAAILAETTSAEAESALETLANASLMEASSATHYTMHDLVRLYAQRCAELEEQPAIRREAIRRLAVWYLVNVDAADKAARPDRGRPPITMPTSGYAMSSELDEASPVTWFEAERDNLLATTRAAQRDGHHDVVWRLPAAMRGLLDVRGLVEDWIKIYQVGLASARELGDVEGEGWMLNGLGTGYWRRAEYEQAIDCYNQVLELKTAAGDDHGVAVALNNLSNVFGAQGRSDAAMGCLRQAVAIHASRGDELAKSFALNNLGHLLHEVGRLPEALSVLEDALRIRRELGSPDSVAITQHCIGDTLNGLGRHSDALSCLRNALAVFRRLGNQYGEAVALHSIGLTFRAMNKPDHALRFLRLAVSCYRDLEQRGSGEAAAALKTLAVVTEQPV